MENEMQEVEKSTSKPSAPLIVKESKTNGVAKKLVKKSTKFVFSDISKIEEWSKTLPPQARVTLENLPKFGIKFGEQVTLADIHAAYVKMAAAGILVTRQAPSLIFNYYRQWYRGDKGGKILMKELSV